MSISNGNFVCITCRTAKRGDIHRGFVDCNQCRKPMIYIGQHWRVPKKTDDDGWAEIRGKDASRQNPNIGF